MEGAGALAGENVRHGADGLVAVKTAPAAAIAAGPAAAALTDGRRRGKTAAVPAAGVTLAWKRTARKVAALVLYPPRGGKGSPPWPRAWTVEARAGRGRWRPVKDLRTAVLRGATPARGRRKIPQYVKLGFKPISTRALRLRPVLKKGRGTVRLSEVEVYRRP